MNPYDFPLFFDLDYCSDDAWSIKDVAGINSSIDFDMDCMAFTDLTDDYRKRSRIISDAVNIPQTEFVSARNKDYLESPSFFDSDINFYDHFADSKSTSFSSIDAEASSPLSFWGTPVEIDQPKFDEIFQVEESKAIQGPTLAQLNSNTEPSFDSLSFNDIYTEEMKPSINDSFFIKTRNNNFLVNDLVTHISERKVPVINTSKMFSEDSQVKLEENRAVYLPCEASSSYISNVAVVSPTQISSFTRIPVNTHSLLKSTVGVTKLQQLLNGNIPTTNTNNLTDLPMPSTSAPKENTEDSCVEMELPEKQTVRQRNNSSTDRSLCSFSSLSLSNDEGFDSSREEFGPDEDESSDADSGDPEKYNSAMWLPTMDTKHKLSETRKRKKYFWQYNIQSKGPKGLKVPLESRFLDPHFFTAASDPVFSLQSSVVNGTKHTGKARRGDGNDLTPNPHKLYSIGLELKKLSKIINDLEPTVEQPFNSRPKSRREKNKLASRVCRLKKKAQHEANKLKFYGLQKEHSNLCVLLGEVKQLTTDKLLGRKKQFILQDIEKLITSHGVPKVAGNTAEFVNHILTRVADGDPGGGVYRL